MSVQQMGVVFRLYGRPDIAESIKDGMEKGIRLNTDQMAIVKAENEKMRDAREGVRKFGDDKRWPETREKLAAQYYVKPCGRVRAFLLVLWALLWMEIFDWTVYLQHINRSA